METIDLTKASLRDVNEILQRQSEITNQKQWEIINPKGAHAIAVGLNAPLDLSIKGSTGYYCGGMNQKANIYIEGNAATGLGEKMMSGIIHVKGNTSQSAGATAHGGTIIIDGDASSRCGFSMKGVDIIVKGSVGHMSAFMAQAGTLMICGDAGDALGDSIYEAVIYMAGKPNTLGVDCIEKKIFHSFLVEDLLSEFIGIFRDLLHNVIIISHPIYFFINIFIVWSNWDII